MIENGTSLEVKKGTPLFTPRTGQAARSGCRHMPAGDAETDFCALVIGRQVSKNGAMVLLRRRDFSIVAVLESVFGEDPARCAATTGSDAHRCLKPLGHRGDHRWERGSFANLTQKTGRREKQ